jgi:hypothetical protein
LLAGWWDVWKVHLWLVDSMIVWLLIDFGFGSFPCRVGWLVKWKALNDWLVFRLVE